MSHYLRDMLRLAHEVHHRRTVNGVDGEQLAKYLLSEGISVHEAESILQEEGFVAHALDRGDGDKLRVSIKAHPSNPYEGKVVKWALD